MSGAKTVCLFIVAPALLSGCSKSEPARHSAQSGSKRESSASGVAAPSPKNVPNAVTNLAEHATNTITLPHERAIELAVLDSFGLKPGNYDRTNEGVIFLTVPSNDVVFISGKYSGPFIRVRSEDDKTVSTEFYGINGSFFDRKTGMSASFIGVKVQKLLFPEAEANFSSVYGGLGGSFYAYLLKFEDGRWRVVERKLTGAM
jgi:hypothetical protein